MIRDINATFMGARAVNPDVEMKVVWVNTWFDPAKEADAANTLIDQGVDVIVQHTDSPAPLLAAQKRGVWGVGQASDMSHFAPEAHLLSVVNDWGPYYIKSVQDVMDGTWKTGDYWGGIHDGVIKIEAISDKLTADQRSKVDAMIASIDSGEFHPFTGPIKDQSGTVRVADGVEMTHEELAGMDWYVEGMTATIPQ